MPTAIPIRVLAFWVLIVFHLFVSKEWFRLIAVSAVFIHYAAHFFYSYHDSRGESVLLGRVKLCVLLALVAVGGIWGYSNWFMILAFSFHITFNDVYVSAHTKKSKELHGSCTLSRLVFNFCCYYASLRGGEWQSVGDVAPLLLYGTLIFAFLCVVVTCLNARRFDLLLFDGIWFLVLIFSSILRFDLDSLVFYHVVFWILAPIFRSPKNKGAHILQQVVGIFVSAVLISFFPSLKNWVSSIGVAHMALALMASHWNPQFLKRVFQPQFFLGLSSDAK